MEARDQLQYNFKRASDASSLRRLLEDYRMQAVTAQEKVKDMEKRLLLSESNTTAMNNLEDHLLKINCLERENMKLKLDNTYLRSNTKNVMVLTDQLEILKNKLSNAEEKIQNLSKHESIQKSDFDISKTKVLRFSTNPTIHKNIKFAENTSSNLYWQEVDALKEEYITNSESLSDYEKKIEAAERKNKRLKEVFAKKIQEFREICYCLTGYRIDNPSENHYRLLSIFSKDSNDCLNFQCTSSGQMQLFENNFSCSLHKLIDIYLGQHDSIPAFLSAVTLELFNKHSCQKPT